MASPRVSRPADSRSREAACLARSTVLRSGRRQRRERLDAGIDHPVQHPQAGERPRVGPPGPLQHPGPVGTRRGGGQPDPDLHARSSRRWCRCGAALVARAGSWYGSGMRAGVILLVVAAVLAASLGLLWAFQRRLIYLPSPGPVPPAASVLPGAEDVSFETADGLRLQGWFVPGAVDSPAPPRPRSVPLPEGAPPQVGEGEAHPKVGEGEAHLNPGPAVLVCNGNGGDRAVRAGLGAGPSRMGLAGVLFRYPGDGGEPG